MLIKQPNQTHLTNNIIIPWASVSTPPERHRTDGRLHSLSQKSNSTGVRSAGGGPPPVCPIALLSLSIFSLPEINEMKSFPAVT